MAFSCPNGISGHLTDSYRRFRSRCLPTKHFSEAVVHAPEDQGVALHRNDAATGLLVRSRCPLARLVFLEAFRGKSSLGATNEAVQLSSTIRGIKYLIALLVDKPWAFVIKLRATEESKASSGKLRLLYACWIDLSFLVPIYACSMGGNDD